MPAGWEAEFSTQQDPAVLDTSLAAAKSPLVVLHVANFSLPPNRDDYGSEAVEHQGRSTIFMALIEFAPTSAGSALFVARGIPSLNAADFAPDRLLRRVGNQAGLQSFFHSGHRAFCLYTVIGSYSMRKMLVGEANSVLSGLRIS